MEAGTTTATARAATRARIRAVAADYFDMMKPRVQTLLLFTTITTMYVAGSPSIGLVALTCLGGALSAGGAGAINHWFDRDLDAIMTRMANRSVPAGRVHARHLFTIQVTPARRRPLYDFLHARGVLANVHYIPVHTLPYYRRRGWAGKRLPNAEAYYAGTLSLPMHAGLTDADVRRVIEAVRAGLASA